MRTIAITLALSALFLSRAAGQGTLTYTFSGDSPLDRFGSTVAAVGDVDGDGHGDLIVGASGDDDNGNDCGSVRVHSGADGSILHTFYGDSAGAQLGLAVGGAGDVDGDGFADLIAGAPGESFGWPGSGTVKVYSGATGAVLFTFHGTGSYHGLGFAVGGLGDVNGDGHDDLLVGIPYDDFAGVDAGRVRVYSGFDGAILYSVVGDSSYDTLGGSVAGVGDVNGDGIPDFIAGAKGDDNNGLASGSARVYSGVDGSVLFTFDGDSAGDYFGTAVSGAGDVNGDGRADLFVGAPGDSNTGVWAGSARVFSGLDGSILYTFDGAAADHRLGQSVGSMGDANGDGYADVVVSSFNASQPVTYPGLVQVFSGYDGSILDSQPAPMPSFWGCSVAGGLDVNGDGFPGYAVGAYGVMTYTGEVRVFEMPSLPILIRRTTGGGQHLIDLSWEPALGDPFALTGTLHVTGATPGAIGLVLRSWAGIDYLAFGYLPLLVAIDPVNFIDQGNFGFDLMGEFHYPGVSRQVPALAGFKVYVQLFEVTPVISSSPSIRFELAP